MKNYNKKGFETAFKKAVPNFNELIAHFEHPRTGYDASTIVFVWNGALWKLKIYKSDYNINLWKNHFIEFFNTGNFDYNAYWKLYTGGNAENRIWLDEKIFKIPLCKRFGSDFSEHSETLDRFYKTSEGCKIGRRYGFTTIPKPLDDLNVITVI